MCVVWVIAQVHPLRPHFVTGEADIVIRSKAPAKGTERLREPKKPETRLVHFWDFSKRVPLPGSPMRFQRHIYCAAFSGDGTIMRMCLLCLFSTLFSHCVVCCCLCQARFWLSAMTTAGYPCWNMTP
jgi:hypothetical protein